MLGDAPSGLSRVPVLRPLLEVLRSDIEAFARLRALAWVEDESNDDTSLDRNYLRRQLLPLVEQRFPAARATIARSAGRSLKPPGCCTSWDAWISSAAAKAKAGRSPHSGHWVQREREMRCALYAAQPASPVPGAAQLAEWWRQLARSREDARLRIDLGARSLHRYRGTLILETHRTAPSASFRAVWRGERRLSLPALGGVLAFTAAQGAGVSVEKLNRAAVTVRLREGGERLQPDARRPRRTLKNLLQEHGVPPWRREHALSFIAARSWWPFQA